MNEEAKTGESPSPVEQKPRPVLLTVFCLFAFIYLGLLTLLFAAGLFNAAWITEVTHQYISSDDFTQAQITLFFGTGFLLHLTAFTGVVLIWKLRRPGYYFLGISCLVFASMMMLLPSAAVTSTAVYILLLFFFGIFYRRLH